MWCTHPLLGKSNGSIFADGFDLTAGSTIVTSGGASTDFTLLCKDMQVSNVPVNRYIAYYNGTSYGTLEVDYVLDAATLILKYPAFETATVGAERASLIDYWGTPILKEITVTPASGGSGANQIVIVNKFSSNTYALFDTPWTEQNEGGLEPMLFTATADYFVKLSY